MKILAEISVGELVDKLTILEIKLKHIAEPPKRDNVSAEYASLSRTLNAEIELDEEARRLRDELKAVNESLWRVEDDLRACEREARFDDLFVQFARSVYRLNDRRAELKRRLNLLTRSAIVEEKSYAAY